MYKQHNKWEPKNILCISIFGDKTTPEEFKSATKDLPWLALPLDSLWKSEIAKYIPLIDYEEYPTVGVMNGLNGKVLFRSAFGTVDNIHVEEWLDSIERPFKWNGQIQH